MGRVRWWMRNSISLPSAHAESVRQNHRPASGGVSSPPTNPATWLIAQEIEPLFPGAVAEHDGMKALAYSALVPVTVGAIQELNQKLERKLQQKETEIAELKARLDKLERQMDQKRAAP